MIINLPASSTSSSSSSSVTDISSTCTGFSIGSSAAVHNKNCIINFKINPVINVVT